MRPYTTSYCNSVSAALLCCVFIFINLACSSNIFQGLKGDIQKELDSNPFLKEEGVKLQVASEENGYVTLEMYEGNRDVREDIYKGTDIVSNTVDMENLLLGASKHEKQTITALRRTIEQIKEMEGVKQVILTALVNTPIDRARDAYEKKNYTEAVGLFQEAARQGNIDAQFTLGYMYCFGQGVQQDYEKAVQFYREAADQGNANAQFTLGYMYHKGVEPLFDGQGVQQDYEKAVQFYREAADQGNASAQYYLGSMYHYGRGVRQDYQKALQLFRKATEQGYERAYHMLAWLLATCPDESVRNGKNAIVSALKAVSADSNDWGNFDVLAAAYARDGQFSKAVETQERVMKMLLKKSVSDKNAYADDWDQAAERLKLYQSQRPFTASPTPGNSQ